MLKLQHLTVGNGNHPQIPQAGSIGAVDGILLRHKLHETGILRTGHSLPGVGGVLGYTGTHEVEYQLHSVLTCVHSSIISRIIFQNPQAGKEGIVVGNLGFCCHDRCHQTDDHAQAQQNRKDATAKRCFHSSFASL